MMNRMISRLSILAALAAVLTASPVLAQGQGKGKNGEKAKQSEVRGSKGQQKRPELQRRDRDEQRDTRTRTERSRDDRYEDRDDDRYEDDRYDDRSSTTRGNGSGRVPPGWCKGEGNPHNTPENCGYNGNRRTNDRYGRDTYSRSGRNGSYEESHAEFHRYLDRKYSDLADDRPLDPMYQVRIRRDRKAEHDRWHAEAGRRHDG